MATEFPDSTSVRVTRSFAAAIDRVWRAHTLAGEMAQWMWAGWGSDCEASTDLRVGGRYEVYMTPPSTEPSWPGDRFGFLGYYTDVVAPHRLVYTLHWDAPVGYNVGTSAIADEAVIVDLREVEGGVEVVRWHIGIPAIEGAAAEHGRGIEAEFDALEQLIGGKP